MYIFINLNWRPLRDLFDQRPPMAIRPTKDTAPKAAHRVRRLLPSGHRWRGDVGL